MNENCRKMSKTCFAHIFFHISKLHNVCTLEKSAIFRMHITWQTYQNSSSKNYIINSPFGLGHNKMNADVQFTLTPWMLMERWMGERERERKKSIANKKAIMYANAFGESVYACINKTRREEKWSQTNRNKNEVKIAR